MYYLLGSKGLLEAGLEPASPAINPARCRPPPLQRPAYYPANDTERGCHIAPRFGVGVGLRIAGIGVAGYGGDGLQDGVVLPYLLAEGVG